MTKNFSHIIEFGCTEHIEFKITEPFLSYVISSNAFEMIGCFYAFYKRKNRVDEKIDLFITHSIFEKEFEVNFAPGDILEITYSGWIPKDRLVGTKFCLVVTLKGVECSA